MMMSLSSATGEAAWAETGADLQSSYQAPLYKFTARARSLTSYGDWLFLLAFSI